MQEAFGLTVVEAMACGLPTFATAHGGPAEIIRHRRNGFHIDPFHGAAAAEAMADFFEKAAADGGVWDAISAAAVERVETRFRWPIYAKRLANLCSTYTFWRHVTGLERREAKRYLEVRRSSSRKLRTNEPTSHPITNHHPLNNCAGDLHSPVPPPRRAGERRDHELITPQFAFLPLLSVSSLSLSCTCMSTRARTSPVLNAPARARARACPVVDEGAAGRRRHHRRPRVRRRALGPAPRAPLYRP